MAQAPGDVPGGPPGAAPAPPPGPPYVPVGVASVGGHPTVHEDVPVCAILICIYLAGAISNYTIYQLNRKKGHKFIMSVIMMGFCMSRVGANVLRLVWATRPMNVRISIAALIFTNIGVLIVYIIVLQLNLRVFRAKHPKLGWNRPFRKALTVSYVLLLCAILLTIAFTILNFYTLKPHLKNVAIWVQRGALLYMMIFNVMSLTLLSLSLLLPRAPNSENFGTGSMGSKLIILGLAVFFCIFIAGFRTGVVWAPPRPASRPGWYDTKPAFYVIEFGFEIVIIYMFILTRFDRRFWIPNGSNKPGDYSQVDLDGSTALKTMEHEHDLGSDHD